MLSEIKFILGITINRFIIKPKEIINESRIDQWSFNINEEINANDPITLETLGDLHLKKIKYLSKIKTKLPDGKIITHCYDTIPFYNYILSCYNKNEEPKNLAIGRELLTTEQKNEVFKKIKYFTKQPTLKSNINKKYLDY